MVYSTYYDTDNYTYIKSTNSDWRKFSDFLPRYIILLKFKQVDSPYIFFMYVINQRTQDNQLERGIPNQVSNPRDELYRNVLQDLLSWDKENYRRRKSVLTCFYSPSI